jgi:hypothetical protein
LRVTVVAPCNVRLVALKIVAPQATPIRARHPVGLDLSSLRDLDLNVLRLGVKSDNFSPLFSRRCK